MLVRDLELHLTNLYNLHKKAIIVRHKEVTDYQCIWTLLEKMPSSLDDYEITEFTVVYDGVIDEIDVFLTYKKGETE